MEEIITKACTNQKLNQGERIRLNIWLSKNARNRMIYAQMKLALMHPPPEKRETLKREIWEKIKNRVNNEKNNTESTQRWRINALKIAASITVLISVALGILEITGSWDKATEASLIKEVKVIEKVSLSGQRVTTQLPDGSLVKLNAGSKIIVPEGFDESSRVVSLFGEAFFEVVKDPKRPFRIKTKDIEIEVLGTSFNLRSYPHEEMSEVAVETGKVKVTYNNNKLSDLFKGERVTYAAKTGSFIKDNYEWENVFGWKDNILLFDGDNLGEVLSTLGQWYGVEFLIESTVVNHKKRYSGRYVNQSLEVVLQGLSYVYQFEYEIQDELIVIK